VIRSPSRRGQMAGLIYHIALAEDWEQAQAAGQYTTSTRGLSLEQVGYLHASREHQVAGVANAFYQGAPDLVVLVIDTDRVRAEIRVEQLAGMDGEFPHIYGPLNTDAVTEVRPLRPGPGGQFTFGAGGSPSGA
jgi:uncharacterized protein (DUF952 family)